MPKEKNIALILYEGKQNHFVWFGNEKQNEGNEKQNEEALILNFDDQDFYFYWSDFKIQHSKKFEYLKKNYSEILDFQQKEIFDKFHASHNQEDLIENILDIKLKTVYVLRMSWVKYQQIKSLISESRNLDKELNFKNQSKLSKNNADNWNLKGKLLLNKISIFRNSGFFIEDDINKFLDSNLIVNNKTSEQLSLDFKNQNLLEKVLSLENNYEQLNSEIINFIDNLEQRNKSLTEISDKELESQTKPEGYILKLQKNLNSNWQSQLILNNNKKLNITSNIIASKNAKILRLQEKLKLKSVQFSKANNTIANKDTEILRLQEQLKLKSDELLRTNNVINSYDNEFIKLKSDLREYYLMLNNKNISDEMKNRIIDSKDNEILRLQEQLNLKSDELLRLNNFIINGASEILILEEQLKLKSDHLSKAIIIINNKDTEILRLQDQLKLKRPINESEYSNSQLKKQKMTYENSSYVVNLSKTSNNDQFPLDLSINNDELPLDLSIKSENKEISLNNLEIFNSNDSINSIDLDNLIENNSDSFCNFSDKLISNYLIELEENELEF